MSRKRIPRILQGGNAMGGERLVGAAATATVSDSGSVGADARVDWAGHGRDAVRILLIATDAYGAHGGIAQYNRDLVDCLVTFSEVDEVVVAARNVMFPATDLPPRVRFVGGVGASKLEFLLSLRGLGRFDRVICGHIHLLPVAAAFALRPGTPLSLLVYGIDVWTRPRSPLASLLLRRVDAIWSISGVTRDRMRAWSGLPGSRFSLLPNAIHLERYGLSPRRADLVERFGVEGREVLLTLGRLSAAERYKGVDEVLEVLPGLIARRPRLVYLIAGDGDDRPRLEAKARALGLADRVVFAGFIAEGDKADLYRLADAFVMPGRGEGFGFVFLEAMACGAPVVASRLDGSFEAVREGSLGRAVDPDDRAALLESIDGALGEQKRVPEGLTYFSFPRFAERLREALSELAPPSTMRRAAGGPA